MNPFHSLTHQPGTTQQQHRALLAISNTDLGRVADAILGIPPRDNAAAFAFGAHFHEAILERPRFLARTEKLARLYSEGVRTHERDEEARQRRMAGGLADGARAHKTTKYFLRRGTAEQSYTAVHEATGLLVKARPDLIVNSPKGRRRTLVDFKTTSCRDLAQFLTTIEQYNYDRQAAFYCDLMGAQRFVLIAVQKRPGKGEAPATWVVELSAEQLAAGRRKYERLMRAVRANASRMVSTGQLRMAITAGATTAGAATVTLAVA